jgi:hypothetical protein
VKPKGGDTTLIFLSSFCLVMQHAPNTTILHPKLTSKQKPEVIEN